MDSVMAVKSAQATPIAMGSAARNPWPSAYTQMGDLLLKIWKAEVIGGATGTPGQVLTDFIVATGEGGLRVLELQPANSKRMPVDAFLRGHPLTPETVLS